MRMHVKILDPRCYVADFFRALREKIMNCNYSPARQDRIFAMENVKCAAMNSV